MKKVYLVSYDNGFEHYDKVCVNLPLAIEEIKAMIETCKEDWENVNVIWLKTKEVVEGASIYLQDDKWDELINANIKTLDFVD